MNRLFSVTRRRPHIVDLSTPRQQPDIPTQDGYRISVALNFDAVFSDIIDSTNVGFLDSNVNQHALDVQNRPGKVRIVFDPDTYALPLLGQTGTAATVSAFGAGVSTLTGLTGMTVDSVGRYLTVSGADTAGNNGTFLIVTHNSATSVDIANPAGAAGDANNGSIIWAEQASNIVDTKSFWMRLQPLVGGAPSGPPGAPTLVLPDQSNHGLGIVVIEGSAPSGADSGDALQLDLPRLMDDFTVHNREAATSLFVSMEFEGAEKEFKGGELSPVTLSYTGTQGSLFVRGGGATAEFSASFTSVFPR